jgi:hypothetical protein
MATPFTARMPLGRASDVLHRRTTRTLAIALLISLALHGGWSLWPVDETSVPEQPPLTATLTEMPAPPPAAATPPPKPAVRAKRPTSRLVTAPRSDVATAAEDIAPPAPAAEPAAPAPPAPPAPAIAEAPPASAPPAPSPMKVLPPRLDLAYKVYMGTQGFFVGDATYRFEHDDSTYRISTVGQARGFAALIVQGRGKVVSQGRITPQGLQPLSFEVERGRPDRHEIARFDWDNKVVTLHDDKTAPLDELTFDPLTVLWQSYFTPPTGDQYTFSVATTRKLYRYIVTREGEERIAWRNGEVDTVRWHRKSEDSRTEAWFWLAPSMHYIPIKIRVTQTARGTLEVMLDEIRTDATQVTPGTDTEDPPLASPVERINPFAEHGS